MASANKFNKTAFIVLELILGVVLSLIFLKFTSNNVSDDLWGKTIADGIIRFYAILSLIFFFSVFLIGSIAAINFKQSSKIGTAIGYSLLFWFFSLFVAVFMAQIAPIASMYVVLAGVTLGFNFGIERPSKDSGI